MRKLIVKEEPKSVSAEAYRTLRTNLQFFTMGKNTKKIVITSTEPGEGKSMTTGNLALSMSQAGKRVLIIDCDLRHPSISKYFGLVNSVGFANVIIEKLAPEEVTVKFSENLHIITAGRTMLNPAELLDMDIIKPIFDALQEQYDMILIDTPPVVSVTDAQLLAAVADGVIMVLGSGQAHKKLCQKAMQLLNNVNANIIGIVLNKVSQDSGSYYGNPYPYYGETTKNKKSRIKPEE